MESKGKHPLVIFAGDGYGMGSSRDWAAKGTCLLGVRAVIANSFERIHRSNLLGMGVLPCILSKPVTGLGLTGEEVVHIEGIEAMLEPNHSLTLIINSTKGRQVLKLTAAINTLMELSYYQSGGILPYVLLELA